MVNLETIIALATPRGESAIALIRISGPNCASLCRDALGLPSPAPRLASLCQYTAINGTRLDQVIATWYADRRSYTGEPMLEISCHGSPLIVQRILEDLLARKCRVAEAGEFTRRAFLNGKLDLSQAEAVIDIIRARSDRELHAAQAQLEGAVGRRIERIIEEVLQISAQVEAYIDFPDEDLPAQDQAGPIRSLQLLQEQMCTLIAQSRYRSLLQDGIRTVILGAPNAGKSSLLNALLGEDRAIVSEEPGTTRDFIEDRIHIGPYTLRVIDTAGLRQASSSLEEEGIRRSREQLRRSEICLFVLDTTAPLPQLPPTLLDELQNHRVIIVENKSDLPDSRYLADIFPEAVHSRISAKQGDGIEELKEIIADILNGDIFAGADNDVLISARHAEALEQAKTALAEAVRKLKHNEAAELAAADLRDAREALSHISGKIDNEAMLDHLFSTFCIGK